MAIISSSNVRAGGEEAETEKATAEDIAQLRHVEERLATGSRCVYNLICVICLAAFWGRNRANNPENNAFMP